jgi:hypothetical protein
MSISSASIDTSSAATSPGFLVSSVSLRHSSKSVKMRFARGARPRSDARPEALMIFNSRARSSSSRTTSSLGNERVRLRLSRTAGKDTFTDVVRVAVHARGARVGPVLRGAQPADLGADQPAHRSRRPIDGIEAALAVRRSEGLRANGPAHISSLRTHTHRIREEADHASSTAYRPRSARGGACGGACGTDAGGYSDGAREESHAAARGGDGTAARARACCRGGSRS